MEFIDKNGDGRYSLGRQAGAAGGLLDVIEKAKFGQIYDDGGDIGTVFSKFRLDYDRAAGEIIVAIPVESLSFESSENKLKAEFDFEFFIYVPLPEWGGKKIIFGLHDNVILTENGVEWIYPVIERIHLIR